MLVKNIVNLVKESNDSQSIASISTLVLFSIRILHKFYRKFAGESEKDGDDLDRDVTYLHSIVLVLLKSEQIAVSPETQSISVSEKSNFSVQIHCQMIRIIGILCFQF